MTTHAPTRVQATCCRKAGLHRIALLTPCLSPTLLQAKLSGLYTDHDPTGGHGQLNFKCHGSGRVTRVENAQGLGRVNGQLKRKCTGWVGFRHAENKSDGSGRVTTPEVSYPDPRSGMASQTRESSTGDRGSAASSDKRSGFAFCFVNS